MRLQRYAPASFPALECSKVGFVCACLGLLGFAPASLADDAAFFEKGRVVYQKLCVECHGANGEGVEDEYDEPLYGEKSLSALAKRIDRTMPEGEEHLCVGEDAEAVAKYIYDRFYSPQARAQTAPVKRQLSRLTSNQFRESVADLVGEFHWDEGKLKTTDRGLEANYWGNSNFGETVSGMPLSEKGKIHFARRDDQVNFNYGAATPNDELFNSEEFSARWEGSLWVEESGVYEILIRTENGARFYLNELWAEPLLDASVSSGSEVRELKASVRLLGNRAYPIKLEFFKLKEKSASISLQWKKPNGILEPIPRANLSPEKVQKRTFVVANPFPPDDASDGYERGTNVSKEWLEAVNQAALDTSENVAKWLNEMVGIKWDEVLEPAARRVKYQDFLKKFASRGFRRPMTDGEFEQWSGPMFEKAGEKPEAAVKSGVISVLVSPRFLYPDLGESEAADGFAIAARLALVLWDSVPDRPLREAAEQGQLSNTDQIRQQAQRMLTDPRTKNKLHGFFEHWLEMKNTDDIAKDAGAFPEFTPEVKVDLKQSLTRFIDEIVWAGSSDYRELLQADYLYLNERLAPIYGKEVKGMDFQKVSFAKGERVGILTHPYLLTSMAYFSNSSPIHRGVFLTRSVVGRALKQPPNAIEFKDSDFNPELTMREKVTEITKPTSCMACHSNINPLGFSLESFDAIGRSRTLENGKPVDTRSDFLDDDGATISLASPQDVANFVIGSDAAQKAFIRNLFHHLVKQPIGAFRSDGLAVLTQKFQADGYNIRNAIIEAATIAAMRGMDPAVPKETAAN